MQAMGRNRIGERAAGGERTKEKPAVDIVVDMKTLIS
jgi:hypothetical protein